VAFETFPEIIKAGHLKQLVKQYDVSNRVFATLLLLPKQSLMKTM
jgi:hypothetical protein